MTFLELQTLTSDILDDVQNGYFTLPVLKQRLNLSLKELQKRLISANNEYYSYCVKTNTVVNQSAYAVPTDFVQIIRLAMITQGTGTTAQEMKIDSITPNQRDLITETSGDPKFYYFQKDNLILCPVPNRIVEIHLEYSYLVPDMVGDSDTPDAPVHFHPYIAYLTARDCMVKDFRSIASIEKQLTDYETLLKQIAVQRQNDGAKMVVQTNSLDW